jgi:glutamyl-tRNA synthetase
MPLDEARARISKGDSYVIRQKLPENLNVEFTDPVQGLMSFNTNDIDETVLLKSDGFPTYHLAATVDDHLMGVTHVFRGVEWQSSVAKHVLIYKAFGWEMPIIAHLAVILDPEGGKLSKRHGAVSAKDFLKEGYLPEAVLNFLMLLGWSSPIKHDFGAKEREIFSLKEFIEIFDMKDVNKACPVFNREKLLWFNQKYIQALPISELIKRFTDWLSGQEQYNDLFSKINTRGNEYLEKVLLLEQSRVKLLGDFVQAVNFFYNFSGNIDFTQTKQTKDLTNEQLTSFFKEFNLLLNNYQEDLNDFSHEAEENFVRKYAEDRQLKAGSLFMALRLAITDSQFSPPLLEVLKILGKTETLNRIGNYIK